MKVRNVGDTGIEWTDETLIGRRLGAIKTAARRLGMSFDSYMAARRAGMKHCISCRQWLASESFCSDADRGDGKSAKCRSCSSSASRSGYTTKPRTRGRVFVPAREGDRRQARRRVNYLVELGLIQHPNDVPCTDCGHLWSAGSRRHEYDHHLGYSAEHQLSVEAVCTTCHHARERARGR